MPYKDDEKRRKVVQESMSKIYSSKITVQLRRDSGIDEPLAKAAAAANITKAQYMIQATRRQLITDGFMAEPDKSESE